jgi:hypothetical protein
LSSEAARRGIRGASLRFLVGRGSPRWRPGRPSLEPCASPFPRSRCLPWRDACRCEALPMSRRACGHRVLRRVPRLAPTPCTTAPGSSSSFDGRHSSRSMAPGEPTSGEDPRHAWRYLPDPLAPRMGTPCARPRGIRRQAWPGLALVLPSSGASRRGVGRQGAHGRRTTWGTHAPRHPIPGANRRRTWSP